VHGVVALQQGLRKHGGDAGAGQVLKRFVRKGSSVSSMKEADGHHLS
jgi:hypothetical protein